MDRKDIGVRERGHGFGLALEAEQHTAGVVTIEAFDRSLKELREESVV